MDRSMHGSTLLFVFYRFENGASYGGGARGYTRGTGRGAGRGGRGGRGRGGAGKQTTRTKEELDAELDAYKVSWTTQDDVCERDA